MEEFYVLSVEHDDKTMLIQASFPELKDAKYIILEIISRKTDGDPEKILQNSETKNEKNLYEYYIKELDIRFILKKLYPFRAPDMVFEECCVCISEVNKSDLLDCGHATCKLCCSKLLKPECPICRGTLSGKIVTKRILSSIKRNGDKYNKELERERFREDSLLAARLQAQFF